MNRTKECTPRDNASGSGGAYRDSDRFPDPTSHDLSNAGLSARIPTSEWSTEEDKPLYLAISSLAHHLIELRASRQEAELSRAFAVVERWHVEGDAFVREAATVGLLEDL